MVKLTYSSKLSVSELKHTVELEEEIGKMYEWYLTKYRKNNV